MTTTTASHKDNHVHLHSHNATANITTTTTKSWIRGVNLGGWLVTERWITPYLFALTNCHLDGDFCKYPEQTLNDANGIPLPECDWHKCLPISTTPLDGGRYPMDEYTLTQAFPTKETARRYMELHWDTFVTRQDIVSLKQAGITHLRVPLGYWIFGDVAGDNEGEGGDPYVGGAWPYFARLCEWCRDIGLEVWPDLHGAPGSQNGFDNSGQTLPQQTSAGWAKSPQHVQQTLDIITKIALHIKRDGLQDVVTGFGLLNEPFIDTDMEVLREFYNNGFNIVRSVLGEDIAIYATDMFVSTKKWNDGFWVDPKQYQNTFLDTHPYHVFFENGRSMSPRQHIAYTCEFNRRQVTECCYQDYPNNNIIPSKGISHIVGEWSASFDQLPKTLLAEIMESIAENRTATWWDRKLPYERQAFLRNFVEAQMVTYEAASVGVSSGWFYWNFKMEGGAYAEWDFLRGVREGWIPILPSPNVPSEHVYGTCEEIIFRTDDNETIVHEMPDPRVEDSWKGWNIDDDVVRTHGDSLLPDYRPPHPRRKFGMYGLFFMFLAVIAFYARRLRNSKRRDYIPVIEISK